MCDEISPEQTNTIQFKRLNINIIYVPAMYSLMRNEMILIWTFLCQW